MIGIIYKARNTINNKEYIGQTIQTLYNRRKEGYGDTKFGRAIRKYGKEKFEYVILWELEYEDKIELIYNLNILEEIEIGVRNLTDSNYGYNTKMGGFNGTFKHTEEAIEKIRESSRRPNSGQFIKGQIGINLGRTWKNTEEYKKRHSEIMKKSYISTGRKSGMFGKKQSEESRKKISESLMNRFHGPMTEKNKLKIKEIGRIARHKQWHVNRNMINKNCTYCKENN